MDVGVSRDHLLSYLDFDFIIGVQSVGFEELWTWGYIGDGGWDGFVFELDH